MLGRVDGRGELLGFGQRGGQRIEGAQLLAVGKLDRPRGQFDRPRSVADRGIGARRQNPGRLPQHRDIVGLKTNCLVEMSDGALRPPAIVQSQAQVEVGPGVLRVELQGSLQVGEGFLDFALGGQGRPQDDDRFDRVGLLLQDLAALGNRFASVSVGQQSIGQAETCPRSGGGQPNGLAPLGDGSIVLACASERIANRS